jgi:hypothetical protein
MHPSRSRYVTACQQLLALGVVLVALAPATRVVSLDVVGGEQSHGAASAGLSQQSAGRHLGHSREHGLRAHRLRADRQHTAEVAWHHR